MGRDEKVLLAPLALAGALHPFALLAEPAVEREASAARRIDSPVAPTSPTPPPPRKE